MKFGVGRVHGSLLQQKKGWEEGGKADSEPMVPTVINDTLMVAREKRGVA